MARPYTAKVGRHVTYYRSSAKPVSARIVGTGSVNGGVVLSAGRGTTSLGDATTGILRRATVTSPRNNTWEPR